MVLREEFFPFMEEVKSSVAAMIKGANGSILYLHPTTMPVCYAPLMYFETHLSSMLLSLPKSCWTVTTSTRSSGSS